MSPLEESVTSDGSHKRHGLGKFSVYIVGFLTAITLLIFIFSFHRAWKKWRKETQVWRRAAKGGFTESTEFYVPLGSGAGEAEITE